LKRFQSVPLQDTEASVPLFEISFHSPGTYICVANGCIRPETDSDESKMWLCVMRVVQLQSPWCSAENHRSDLHAAQQKHHADGVSEEGDDEDVRSSMTRTSSRHGPREQNKMHYHERAHFQMI
jgi:hypothetical protein